MRNATDLLARYAEYHRDQRNIASHFVGVPMVVFAIAVLLSWPSFTVGDFALSPAWLVVAPVVAWYLTRGDLTLGIAVSACVCLLTLLAQHAAQGRGVMVWLVWGIGLFLVGWLIQFFGHWYEGRNPAFTDDLNGLLVGPMFVVAELMFQLGWNRPLLAEIERRAGPTRLRDLAKIAC